MLSDDEVEFKTSWGIETDNIFIKKTKRVISININKYLFNLKKSIDQIKNKIKDKYLIFLTKQYIILAEKNKYISWNEFENDAKKITDVILKLSDYNKPNEPNKRNYVEESSSNKSFNYECYEEAFPTLS